MPLRLVLYPNNEISCHSTEFRAVSQQPERSEREPVVAPSILDIRCKLEQKNPEAFAPSKDECRPGYGKIPRGAEFGLRARRRVRRLAGVFDHLPGENLFITLTLPGSTEESLATLSAYSSEVVHRYKVWLCQQAKKYGVGPLKYLYVWELQKRGALHLHIVINCPSSEFRAAVSGSYHARWFKLLKSLSEKTGIDLFRKDETRTHLDDPRVWQSDCQLIDGYIGAYLGKYLSKGSDQSIDDDKHTFFPTRWWGASQGTRDVFSELTVSVNSDGNVSDMYSLIGDLHARFQDGIIRDYEYSLKYRTGMGRVLFISPGVFDEVVRHFKDIGASGYQSPSRGSNSGAFASDVISRLISVVNSKDWAGYERLDAKDRETVSGLLCGDILSGFDYLRLWRTITADCV